MNYLFIVHSGTDCAHDKISQECDALKQAILKQIFE